MPVKPRKWWKIIGTIAGILGVDVLSVFTAIQAHKKGSLTVWEGIVLHPPLLALIASFIVPATIAIIIVILWENLRMLLPRNRFHALLPRIRKLAHQIEAENPKLVGGNWSFDLGAEIRALSVKLGELGIQHPRASAALWHVWLQRMAAWSELKDIRRARKWSEPDPQNKS